MTPSDASPPTPKRPGRGQSKQSSTYTYDADGNVATQVLNYPDVTNTAEGTYTYTYDRAGRLTRFNQASAATTTSDYRWDPANNRTAVITNATVQAWTYDARNRIMTAPDGTYTWDPRGTLDKVVNGGGTTVVDATFDGFGRMTAMTTGSTNIGYTYDGLDRIYQRAGQAFAYNGASIDPSLAAGIKYSRTPSERLMSAQNGATTRLAGLNRHGDLGWLFDTSGNISDTSIYDPFGKPLAQTGSTGANVGFQGDYTDPTSGDVWMGARWYTPSNATFRSRDSIRGMLQTPTSLNRYTYAGGNPVNYMDPDGRWYCANWIYDIYDSACEQYLPDPGDRIGDDVWWEGGYPRGYIGAGWDNSCPEGWEWGGLYGDGVYGRGQCATWNCVNNGAWRCEAQPTDCRTPWLNYEYNDCGGGTCAYINHHVINGFCKYVPPAEQPVTVTPAPIDWDTICNDLGKIRLGDGCTDPPVTATPTPTAT